MAHTRFQNVGLFALIATLSGLFLTAFPNAANAETVLITGANSGIGLEFTKQYLARGWTVISTHRRAEVPATLAELSAKYKNLLRIERVDVTDAAQVKALAERLKGVPIDVLLNNAGIYNDRGTCKPDDDLCAGDWTTQNFGKMRLHELLDTILSVNVKGPLLVSETLFDNVKASKLKKIVAVSSSNGSLTGPQGGGGAIFYRSSKAALNRAMQLVAESVKRDGVTVVMLNPGPTLTEHQLYLKDFKGMLTTEFTVGNMIKTIDKVTLAETGKFWRYDGGTGSMVNRVRGVRGVRLHLAVGARGTRGATGAMALVLCAVLFSATAVAQSKPQAGSRPTLEQDLAALTEFNRRYLKAINDGDIATLSSLTDEDHIMITPGRPPLMGKAANDAANGRAFQTVKIDETWTPEETVVSGDLAYQRGTYTVAATPKTGGNTTRTAGHFLRIYRRQPNGEWRMTHDTFNTVAAPGARGQGAPAAN